MARAASKIDGREHVDAHQREVRLRVLRLLHQARHAAVAVQLGHAVALGVGHGREQDQRVRALAAEAVHELHDPVAQEVVPQVHDERRRAEERLGREHRVREPAWRVLLDVLDLETEVRAVTHRGADLSAGLRRHDDAHLADARLGHGLEPVEEHGLVRHGHELLGAGVRERPQARALSARQDQTLQRVHQYVPSSFRWSQLTTREGTNRSPTRFRAWAATIARTSGAEVARVAAEQREPVALHGGRISL